MATGIWSPAEGMITLSGYGNEILKILEYCYLHQTKEAIFCPRKFKIKSIIHTDLCNLFFPKSNIKIPKLQGVVYRISKSKSPNQNFLQGLQVSALIFNTTIVGNP